MGFRCKSWGLFRFSAPGTNDTGRFPEIMPIQNIHSGHVLGAAALLAPTAGVFAPLLITPIVVLALIGVLILRALEHGSGTRSDRPLVAIVGLISIWSVLSLFWTAGGDSAITQCLSVVAIGLLAIASFIFCPVMVEHERHALRRFILAGIGLAFSLYFVDLATSEALGKVLGRIFSKDPTLFPLVPQSIILLLFLWPAISILWRSEPMVALVAICIGFACAFTLPGAIPATGVIIGTIFFFASLLAARGAMTFLAIAIAAGILIAPFVPRIAPALDPSAIRQTTSSNDSAFLNRMNIWDIAMKKIQDRPFVGWGFSASRTIPLSEAHGVVRRRTGSVKDDEIQLTTHPHSGALQVWYDLGLPGALGFAALFGLAARRTTHQTEQGGKAAALAVIATAAPIWFLSFDAWQIWWIAVLVLTAMLTVALAEPHRT